MISDGQDRTEQSVQAQGDHTQGLTRADAAGIAGFAAVLLVLLIFFSSLMQPVKWFEANRLQNRNARIAQMMAQPPDTIEIMNLGDSLSLSGFNPMELWKERGCASFNIGADGIRMSEAVYAVEEACARQHPKYLLMESLPLLRYAGKTEMQMALSQPLYHRFPFLKFHSIWKTLIDGPGIKIYHRGYLINARSAPYTGDPDYLTDRKIKDTYKAEVPHLNRLYFRRIRDFCARNGITLVLYSMPSPDIYNLPRVSTVRAFAEEEQVPYIDLNEHVREVGIDWSLDTSDEGDHLNLYGSRKATLWLAGQLEALFRKPLADHRGDPAWKDWNDEIAGYDRLAEEMRGLNFADLE